MSAREIYTKLTRSQKYKYQYFSRLPDQLSSGDSGLKSMSQICPYVRILVVAMSVVVCICAGSGVVVANNTYRLYCIEIRA